LRCRERRPFASLAPVALDHALDGVEQIRPYGLRAKISAPDTATDRIHQEQGNGGDDQKPGKIVDLLRPQLDEEKIEAAVGQIDQHRLVRGAQTAVPPYERQQVIDPEAERHQAPFDAAEGPGDALRIDFLPRSIKRRVFIVLQLAWQRRFVHRENSSRIVG
jgi:hypothetical protein